MKNTMLIGVMCILLLSACGGSTPAPAPAPTEKPPTAVPEVEDTPTPEPTNTPTVEPTPVVYTLSVHAEPTEGGSVSLAEGQFEEGSEVDIIAQPSMGYAFDHWSGDNSGNVHAIRMLMDADKTLTAHFVRSPSLVKFTPNLIYVDANQRANALIDFDADGDLDLILVGERPQAPAPVFAFRNDGAGKLRVDEDAFAGYPVETTQASASVVADFNGDGLDDLFIAVRGVDYPGPAQGGQSRILMQIETGQLIDETELRLPQQVANTYDIATGDIDGDGDVDIYMCNASHNTNPGFYINDGAGYFTEDLERIPRSITYRANEYRSSLLVDIDNDEDLDLVMGAARSLYYDTLLINDGAGVFTLAPQTVLPPRMSGINAETNAISAADFDQDGWQDLVMSTYIGGKIASLQLLYNNGDGTFRDETPRLEQDWVAYIDPNCGEDPGPIARIHIVDMNNDGWLDILAQGGACIMHLLFENNGETFSIKENYSDYRFGPLPMSLLPGDMNNDGVMDMTLLYNMHHQVLLRVLPADPQYEREPVVWELMPVEGPQEGEFTCIDQNALEEANPGAVTSFHYRDDFEGALAPGWTWLREEEERWSLEENPGYLHITLEYSFYPRNLLLRPAPEGDFEISTRVLFRPTSNFQYAGLLIYQDDSNRVEFGREYCFFENNPAICSGNALYFLNRIERSVGCPSPSVVTASDSEAYVKIRREGNLFSAYYSEDGVDWTLLGQHVSDLDPMLIGLRAGNTRVPITADFDYFLIETIP